MIDFSKMQVTTARQYVFEGKHEIYCDVTYPYTTLDEVKTRLDNGIRSVRQCLRLSLSHTGVLKSQLEISVNYVDIAPSFFAIPIDDTVEFEKFLNKTFGVPIRKQFKLAYKKAEPQIGMTYEEFQKLITGAEKDYKDIYSRQRDDEWQSILANRVGGSNEVAQRANERLLLMNACDWAARTMGLSLEEFFDKVENSTVGQSDAIATVSGILEMCPIFLDRKQTNASE